jgi:hypothetical protein
MHSTILGKADVVTRLGGKRSWVRVLADARAFCLLQSVRNISEAHSASYPIRTGVLYRCDTGQSSPSSAMVKNE